MQALRRRGVAYELAAILSFEKHEELIDRLFMEYQRDPMPGFHSVSLCQLQAADREVHVRMGELTRAGLTLGADGSLPLDGPLTQVLAGSHIQWMLMPRQKGSGSLGGQGWRRPACREADQTAEEASQTEPVEGDGQDQKADHGTSPNAADKSTKPRKDALHHARALIGDVPKDDSGNNICFDHNLGKCPNAAGSCPKGLHVCCYPSCFDASPVFSHHRSS